MDIENKIVYNGTPFSVMTTNKVASVRHDCVYVDDAMLHDKINAAFSKLAIPLDENVVLKASNSENPIAFVSGIETVINTIEKFFEDDIVDRVSRYRALVELE